MPASPHEFFRLALSETVLYPIIGITVLVLISTYWWFIHIQVEPIRAILIPLFVPIAFLTYDASKSGEIVLRALGVGGGIPIRFVAKTMNNGSHELIARGYTGCLVLNLGGRVIIRKLARLIQRDGAAVAI